MGMKKYSIHSEAVKEDLPKTCEKFSPLDKVNDYEWYFQQAVEKNSKKCVTSMLKNMPDFDTMKSMKFTTSNINIGLPFPYFNMNALQFIVTDYGNENDWGEMCEILLENEEMKKLIDVGYSAWPWLMDGNPLMMAALFNYGPHVASIIECLLQHGAYNIDATDSKGRTALRNAVLQGNEKTCKILLEKGADTKGTIHDIDISLYFGIQNQTFIGDAIAAAIKFHQGGSQSLGCLPVLLEYADVNQGLITSRNLKRDTDNGTSTTVSHLQITPQTWRQYR